MTEHLVDSSTKSVMIDRNARAELRVAFQAFVTGRISADGFLDVEEKISSSADAAVREIFEFAAESVDDIGPQYLRGPYRVTDEIRKTAARAILFLKSDREFEWLPRSNSCVGCLASLLLPALFVGTAFFLAVGAALRHDHLRFHADGGWGVGNSQLKIGALMDSAMVKLFFALRKWDREREDEWSRQGDAEVWPYLKREQLDEDRHGPSRTKQ